MYGYKIKILELSSSSIYHGALIQITPDNEELSPLSTNLAISSETLQSMLPMSHAQRLEVIYDLATASDSLWQNSWASEAAIRQMAGDFMSVETEELPEKTVMYTAPTVDDAQEATDYYRNNRDTMTKDQMAKHLRSYVLENASKTPVGK